MRKLFRLKTRKTPYLVLAKSLEEAQTFVRGKVVFHAEVLPSDMPQYSASAHEELRGCPCSGHAAAVHDGGGYHWVVYNAERTLVLSAWRFNASAPKP